MKVEADDKKGKAKIGGRGRGRGLGLNEKQWRKQEEEEEEKQKGGRGRRGNRRGRSTVSAIPQLSVFLQKNQNTVIENEFEREVAVAVPTVNLLTNQHKLYT